MTRTTTVDGLVLDVARPRRAALRIEAAGRGLLLLRRGATVALLARIDDDRCGVEYLRTGAFQSPVPPIRTAHAAAVAEGGGTAGWAHRFATALTRAADGPLHAGRWAISRPHPSPPLLVDDRGSIDWFGSTRQVLPLRRLGSPDDGRVKSYRKLARAGVLPPILLWWISGLDSYVVLDGHDRLAAAIAEDLEPPLLALSTSDHQKVTDETEAAVGRYLRTDELLRRQVDAGTPGAGEALAAVGRRFAGDLRAIETAHGASRARPLPGGTAAWTELARTHAPDWLTEVTTWSLTYGIWTGGNA